MTKIKCPQTDCKYNDKKNCTKKKIIMNIDHWNRHGVVCSHKR
jgi:hypothetical protein